MGIIRRACATLSLVLVAGGLATAPAVAVAKAETSSATTLAFTAPGTFSGKVTSAKKQCRKTRAITLVDQSGKTVGKATSSKSGAWKVQFNPLATGGVYVAKVAKLKVRIATGKLTCAATSSPPVTVASSVRWAISSTKSGPGSGAITSIPGGIDCGSDCSESYAAGTVVSLVADPSPGSSFAGWTGDCSGDDAVCAVTMSQARDVTAVFELEKHQLAVDVIGTGSSVSSNPSGIACPSDCDQVYDHGTSVTLTPSPATGYAFVGWGGACSGTGGCTVAMTQARSVTATFSPTIRTLNVTRTGVGTVTSADGSIDCGGTCSEVYNHGASIVLLAKPGTGRIFLGWTGDCSGTDELCTVEMTADRTVGAQFGTAPQPLAITRSGSGSGSVSSSPAGIGCGATCTTTFDHGTTVTLTATAATGSTFTGWSGEACSGTGTCQVPMNQARAVTAIFTTNGYTLDVVKAGTGHGTVGSTPAGIACGNSCSAVFGHGTSVTLTPSAGDDSTFTGWGGACTGSGACQVTVDQARSVTATFTLKKYGLALSLDSPPYGHVSSTPQAIDCPPVNTCEAQFDAGTVVTLDPTEDDILDFTGWTGDCSGTGACVLTMDQSHSVTPHWAYRPQKLTVSRTGAGFGGTITPSPQGFSPCSTTCSALFDYGSTVTLTATETGSAGFMGWSGACTGTSPTCQVTMDDAKNVSAQFEDTWIDTTIVGTGSGTVSGGGINCSGSCHNQWIDASPNPAVVTFTATPDDGSVFAGWQVSPSQAATCSFSTTCQVTIAAPLTSVRATFTKMRTLDVTLDGPGSVSSDLGGLYCPSIACSRPYQNGSVVNLTAQRTQSTYVFVGWSGACTGTGVCQVTILQPTTEVTAHFALNTLTVANIGAGRGTVTGEGIDCGDTCSASYNWNHSLELTATPDEDSQFVGWGGDAPPECGSSTTCVVNLQVPRTITARFKLFRPLSVTVTGPGTVQSTPSGINCGVDCDELYEPGTVVTLVANPDSGYAFLGWTGAGCSGTDSCTVTMSGARAVHASFGDGIRLDVGTDEGGGQGTVTSSPAGINCGDTCFAYFAGGVVTLTAQPGPGSSFVGWSGDCAGTQTTCSLLMDHVQYAFATFDR